MAYLGFSTHPPPSFSLARTQTRKSLRGKSIFLSEALDGEECGGKKHRGVNAKQMNVHRHAHRLTSDFSLSGWFVKFHSGVENFFSLSAPKRTTKQDHNFSMA
jgi:hypothetical protein